MSALLRRLLGALAIDLTWLDREPKWASMWDDCPLPGDELDGFSLLIEREP